MDELREKVKAFVRARDWEKYHSPKNVAMSLSVEAGELMEIFLWKTDGESRALDEKELQRVKEEVGDVMINLVNLCNKFGIDPVECGLRKLEKVEEKYPVAKAKGSARKYDEI
jgi:dCTP diphosphatase